LRKEYTKEEKKMSWEVETKEIRRRRWRKEYNKGEKKMGRSDERNKKEDGRGRNTTMERRR
jgi:hypothetical protein